MCVCVCVYVCVCVPDQLRAETTLDVNLHFWCAVCDFFKITLYSHLFIIQTYSRAENTSQFSYFSNQFKYSFFSALRKNYIPIVSIYLAVTSCQLRNPNTLDLSLYAVTHGLLNNQPVHWDSYKNMIFHTNLINTAVKKIITLLHYDQLSSSQ